MAWFIFGVKLLRSMELHKNEFGPTWLQIFCSTGRKSRQSFWMAGKRNCTFLTEFRDKRKQLEQILTVFLNMKILWNTVENIVLRIEKLFWFWNHAWSWLITISETFFYPLANFGSYCTLKQITFSLCKLYWLYSVLENLHSLCIPHIIMSYPRIWICNWKFTSNLLCVTGSPGCHLDCGTTELSKPTSLTVPHTVILMSS